MPRGHKSPARRILFNFVCICAVAALYLILQPPQAITAGRAVAGLIFASVFAVILWLRWDWAPAAAEERRKRQRSEAD